ncbi:MAG: GTPase Era [Steroidobacteraceae bacterium]
MSDQSSARHRAGTVAIVGRPNVGKSTLLNALVGQKLSITSPKPQTTRHRVMGILSDPTFQAVFIDTPGLHTNQPRALNRLMNRAAGSSMADADLILWMVDAARWTAEDEAVLERVRSADKPCILVINKVDRLRRREQLLPLIEKLAGLHAFAAVVPLSAQRPADVNRLAPIIEGLLPEAPPLFPADQVTDRSERFLAAEVIREKLTRFLHQELPYGLTVEIESWQEQDDPPAVDIHAVIWVERAGQKPIVIGKGGQVLKSVGRAARLYLNLTLGRRVHLELWVKVRENWVDSDTALRALGYESS